MSFPLPESVRAADLEIYIQEDGDLGISKSIEGHYYYYYTPPLGQDEDERVDPRTLVRPSAPLFGRYTEGDDQSVDESMNLDDSDVSRDSKDFSDGDIWLEDISVTDEDFEELFSLHQKHEAITAPDKDDVFPSSEPPCRVMGTNSDEESSEEDGEGESLYETVQFGRNRVEMSFLAYNKEWKDAYDYISQGMAGMFYCPYPRPQPQPQWKSGPGAKRKGSRLNDMVRELKKTTEDSRFQSEECLPPSERTNKLAPPPLRVRLLSASLQNRAMATREALARASFSSKYSIENKERGESAEYLHGVELRAIASLYEVEKI